MNKKPLTSLTDAELLHEYERIVLLQDEAFLVRPTPAFNRLFDQRRAVSDVLRAREGDQRRLLIPFLDHPNPWMRITAARDIFSLDETLARRVVQKVGDDEDPPYKGEALSAIGSWDMGYRPK